MIDRKKIFIIFVTHMNLFINNIDGLEYDR